MPNPAINVTTTTEVGYCPFCGRTRNLRREERHLGGLVRTTIDCESCHRTLSSTIGPPRAEPALEPEPAPEPESRPEPVKAAPRPPAKTAAPRAAAAKKAAAVKKPAAAKKATPAKKAAPAKKSTTTKKK